MTKYHIDKTVFHNHKKSEYQTACKVAGSNTDIIAKCENEFLKSLAAAQSKVITEPQAKKITDLMSIPQVVAISEKFLRNGIDVELVNFLVTFVVIKYSAEHKPHRKNKKEKEATPEEEILSGLQPEILEQELRDYILKPYDCRSETFKRKVKAKKIAKMSAMFGIHLAVSAFFPIVGLALLVAGLTHTVLGSSHDVVFATVAHILLQKLFLATQDISIDRFY